MDPENIMRSEISHTEKVKNHDLTHMWDIKLKAANEQTENKQTKTHRHRKQCGGDQREGAVGK